MATPILITGAAGRVGGIARTITELLLKQGKTVRAMVRTNEPCYAEMGLDKADDDTLLAAMAAHPSLMQRPVVVTDRGAKVCDSDEGVEGLL